MIRLKHIRRFDLKDTYQAQHVATQTLTLTYSKHAD